MRDFDLNLRVIVSIFCILVLGIGGVHALQLPQSKGRFDSLVLADPASWLDAETTSLQSLSAADPVRTGWQGFLTANGPEWSIYLDRRSGAPLIVEGQGIAWQVDKDSTAESLAQSLRPFIAQNKELFLADDAELVFDKVSSGKLAEDVWQIVFNRQVAGIPVIGQRYMFGIGHGNLITFGTAAWTRIDTSPIPDLTTAEARDRILTYMGVTADDRVIDGEKPILEFMSLRAAAPGATVERPYTGAIGSGYGSALVWRLKLTLKNYPEDWVALVDAHSGQVRALFDESQYAQIKGGIYPVSSDGICPDGCQQPNYPLPYVDLFDYGPTRTSTSNGFFDCSPAGDQLVSKLNGHYFRISSGCNLISDTVTCPGDINLGVSSPDGQCVVPPGTSAGNTSAARTAFYHLNRMREHVASWIPGMAYVNRPQLDVMVDPEFPDAPSYYITTCNSRFEPVLGGTFVSFYRGADSCRNAGEIAQVMDHEWGHGLDYFDGGGYESPTESYADITAMLHTHTSCVGRGFFKPTPVSSDKCTGYGNTCLTCTGVRDLDWDKRVNHAPSTPAGFVNSVCTTVRGEGVGPCNTEVHCESAVASETMWDLATRDLTAMGIELPTSWQIMDRIWYQSRQGSGGPIYNCPLPASDGCFESSMFNRIRFIDDDDGNLANGTPHAAAIYAAFNRHQIACGNSTDRANQNHTSCPALGTTTLTGAITDGGATLTWTPASNATKYRVLKSELSCAAGQTIIGNNVTGTTFTDTGLSNGIPEYYRVEPIVYNQACDGPVSNCVTLIPQPNAGSISLSNTAFTCGSQIVVTVIDSNIGFPTTTASLVSTTETTPETITLTQIAPGSFTYTGTIMTTSNAPAADGALSVANGDTISATYIDASDGGGNVNVPHLSTALADCALPLISKVQARNVTGTSATITWTTNEPASSIVHSGTTPPPGTTSSNSILNLGHAIDLAGLTECTPYVFSVGSTDVAGNTATDDATGSYYTFVTAKTTQISYASADTPVAIPDNYPPGAASTIVVTDTRTVHDVNVSFNVAHTFDGDLTFKLIAPTGLTILLANPRGDSADNYTGTVLDDQAADPLELPAPFTGTFRPDSPLSVLNGISAAGSWKLLAIDGNAQDVGSILSWTLQLTYSTPTCGPHAVLRSSARVSDTCASGGAGNANTYWDAGEDVQFKVTLNNDGTVPLTGVTATVTSTTPGVVMTDGVASFPDTPAGASADSIAPNFTVHLPTALACGGTVSFQVAIQSAQGSWAGTFAQGAGRPTNGTGRVLSESFDAGIPATWTVVDGGSGGGAASQWTAANPGIRTAAAPMFVPVATVDSDAAGPGAVQDESLLTPVLNLSGATTATLQFDEFFDWYPGNMSEIADVDVKSSLTGGAWVNVLRQQNASSANPAHEAIDVSAQLAGATDAQVRFRDWNGSNELYWQIDNVTLDTAAPGSCAMPVCSSAGSGAKPVPDGAFGVPMRGSRANAAGSTIALTWDIGLCTSADYHVLYGNLASVASLTPVGAACDLGTTGSASWSGVPAGSLWFVVVGDDNATTEGSWGTDGVGGQRGGASFSGFCSMTARNNSATCP